MPLPLPTPTGQNLSRAVFQLVAATAVLALLWYLRSVVILVFGVVIVAAVLVALAVPLARVTRLKERTAVLCVVLATAVVLGLGVWGLGDPLAEQFQELRTALPKAWQGLRQDIGGNALGAKVLAVLDTVGASDKGKPSADQVPWQRLADFAGAATGFVADVLLIVVMGLYLALDPSLYKRGVVSLVPPVRRERVNAALDAAGQGLSRWLLGQGIAMAAMAVAATAGLALLDIPLAAALGLLTGLLEFIPFFGPIVAGAMAVLVAFAQGPEKTLYVAIMFIVLQQLEGNVLMPFLQRWAVDLPPVLGVLAVVLFGTIFGVPGVVFGTPLMVVAMILIDRLYVQPLSDPPPPA